MNHNEQAHPERDDHALLTASVFGELSSDEQAALDARLVQEPALREQREAIVSTAWLVRESFPEGESLPPELLASLERAASAGAAVPLRSLSMRSNWVRLAAGLTLLCGGAIAANEWFKHTATDEDALAKSERRMTFNLPGATVDPKPIDSRNKSDYKPVKNIDVDGATDIKRETYFDPASPDESAEVLDHLREFGRRSSKSSKTRSQGAKAELKTGIESNSRDSRSAGLAGEPREQLGAQRDGGDSRRLGDLTPPQGESGSDDFFIGHGQVERGESLDKSQVPATGQPNDRPGTAHGGNYRGPGGGVPPGSNGESAPSRGSFNDRSAAVGAAKPNPTAGGGPSSPGPAGAATPGLVAGESRSPSAVTATPEAPSEAESLERLRGLGYVVGETTGDPGRFRKEVDGDEAAEVIEFDDLVRWQEVEQRKKLKYGEDDADLTLDQERKRDFSGRRLYTDAELDAITAARSEVVLRSCRRLPNERPNMMFFRFYGDNAFELAHLDPQSTFGADVDTASYTLARRYLRDGLLPEKAQIRTEEFVNYFKPDLAPPAADSALPFAVHTELGISRFGTEHWGFDRNASESADRAERYMLRVGVRGKVVAREDRQPLQLTFVVDTSGSMKEGNRMELVKHALRLLLTELDANDSIALIAFSNEARQVLPMTSAANRGLIETAIHGLTPNGGTNAEAGLRMGYELAGLTLAPGNHSRVVLLSDGVANVGQTDQNRVNEDVRKQRERGIYLNTVGVGMGNHNDTFLEQLANKGDGLCNYVDDEREARRALVENFTGAFETIARDLKVQVEFDPSQVYRYRLLGYENRAIADVDFRNDKVDAGEIGAGHQVVALYELELTGNASEQPMAQVRVRWKAPTGAGRHPEEDVAAGEFSFPVNAAIRKAWDATSIGFQRDTCVAQFAEILRRSMHARGDSLDDLIAQSTKLAGQLGDPDFVEFVDMLNASRRLIIERAPRSSDLTDCVDALRRNRILRAQIEELRREQSAALLSDLEQQNAQLELRLRDLIRQELEQELK